MDAEIEADQLWLSAWQAMTLIAFGRADLPDRSRMPYGPPPWGGDFRDRWGIDAPQVPCDIAGQPVVWLAGPIMDLWQLRFRVALWRRKRRRPPALPFRQRAEVRALWRRHFERHKDDGRGDARELLRDLQAEVMADLRRRETFNAALKEAQKVICQAGARGQIAVVARGNDSRVDGYWGLCEPPEPHKWRDLFIRLDDMRRLVARQPVQVVAGWETSAKPPLASTLEVAAVTPRAKRVPKDRSVGDEDPQQQPDHPPDLGVDAVILAELVRLIAGPKPTPGWLGPGLAQGAVPAILFSERIRNEYPDGNWNAELRWFNERLDECDSILAMLVDYRRILALEVAAGFDDLEGQHSAYHGLISLKAQLQAAIGNIEEEKKRQNIRGKGRHKAYSGTSPQLTCAIFVTVAWQVVRGVAPPYTNVDALKACQCLWALTDLGRVHYGDTDRAWEPHLKEARDLLADGYYPNARRALGVPQC
jgi:hypothetical protein